MKKIFLWMLVGLVGLFTSCTEDALVKGNGELTTTRITVGIPGNSIATRGATFADPKLENMRVCLMVSVGDNKIVYLETKENQTLTTAKSVTFDVQLVTGKEYNIAAWADFGADYYTLPAVNDAPVVKLAENTPVGSDNKNDAYFQNQATTITANSTIDLVLRRPFALVKVNTTDWEAPAVVNAGYQPTKYTTTINVPTSLNLVTGNTGDNADVTFAGDIVAKDGETMNPKELTFDYILANTVSANLPEFTVAYSNTDPVTSYTFQNIPVQRNYKTNITGNILTKKGHITISIDPIWNEPDFQNTPTFEDAQAYINAHKGESGSTALLIEETVASGETKKLYIPDNTTKDKWIFQLANMQDGGKIEVYDEHPSDGSVNYKNEVEVILPQGVTANSCLINTPNAHATVSGQFTTVEATTSGSTLVVALGATIDVLNIKKGNVDLYGTVNKMYNTSAAAIADQTLVKVYMKGGTWTNETAADGGATAKLVPMRECCKIGDAKYFTLNEAFDAATTDQTIELLSDATLSSTITLDKSVNLNMAQKNIKVTAFGSAFVLNTNGGLNVTNGSFTQGAPWSDGCGDNYNYFIFELKTNSSLSLNTVTCADYNTHDGSLIRVNGGGGATINLTNSTFTTDFCVFNSYTQAEQTANTLNVQGCTFQSGTNQSLNLYYTNATIGKNGETKTQFSGTKGMNAYSGVVANLTEVVANCSGTCVYYADDSKGTLTNCDFTSTSFTIGAAGDVNRSVGGSQVTGDITIDGGTYVSHGSDKNAVLKIYTSGGKITANSGTFTNDNGGYVAYADSRNSGNVNVGTDTQPACVVVNGDAVLNGKIGTQHKAMVYVHGGTLNVEPALKGDFSPIEADGGTFSFDPATTNVTGTSTKAVNIVDGYKAVAKGTDPETWTIVDANPVKNITKNVGYETLSAAATDASDGDEIRLNSDVTETANVLVKDKAITIDLNSNTLDMGTYQFRVEHVVNSTSLSAVIFDDKSTGKAGVINSSAQYFIYFDTNGPNACTLNAGTINHSGSNHTFNCYSAIDLTMNGGKIHKTNANSLGNNLFYVNNGELTINDGEFISEGTSYATVVEINNGKMNIKGGTLKSISTGSQSYCIKGGYSSLNINISGGSLSAYSDSQSAYTINNGSSNVITITGGTLSADTKSTSSRQAIKNIYNTLSSSSSITGGTYKVGYKWSGTTKQYLTGIDNGVPSTHQITEVGTEGNQKIYKVTVK